MRIVYDGFIEVVKFLCDTRGIEEPSRTKLLVRTSKNKHRKTFDDLYNAEQSSPTFAMILAAENEQRKIFDFLRNLATE